MLARVAAWTLLVLRLHWCSAHRDGDDDDFGVLGLPEAGDPIFGSDAEAEAVRPARRPLSRSPRAPLGALEAERRAPGGAELPPRAPGAAERRPRPPWAARGDIQDASLASVGRELGEQLANAAGSQAASYVAAAEGTLTQSVAAASTLLNTSNMRLQLPDSVSEQLQRLNGTSAPTRAMIELGSAIAADMRLLGRTPRQFRVRQKVRLAPSRGLGVSKLFVVDTNAVSSNGDEDVEHVARSMMQTSDNVYVDQALNGTSVSSAAFDDLLLGEYGSEGVSANQNMTAARDHADLSGTYVWRMLAGFILASVLMSVFLAHPDSLKRLYSHKFMSVIITIVCARTVADMVKRALDRVWHGSAGSASWALMADGVALAISLAFVFLSSVAAVSLRHRRLDSFAIVKVMTTLAAFVALTWCGCRQQQWAEDIALQHLQGVSIEAMPVENSYIAPLLALYCAGPFFMLACFRLPSRLSDWYRDATWEAIVSSATARASAKTDAAITRASRAVSIMLPGEENGASTSDNDDTSFRHDDIVSITRHVRWGECDASAIAFGFFGKQLVVFLLTRRTVPMECTEPIQCYMSGGTLFLYVVPILLLCCAIPVALQLTEARMHKHIATHIAMILSWTVLDWIDKVLAYLVWTHTDGTSFLHSESLRKMFSMVMLLPAYGLLIELVHYLVEEECVGHLNIEAAITCLSLTIGMACQMSLELPVRQLASLSAESALSVDIACCSLLAIGLLFVWRQHVVPTAMEPVPHAQPELQPAQEDDDFEVASSIQRWRYRRKRGSVGSGELSAAVDAFVRLPGAKAVMARGGMADRAAPKPPGQRRNMLLVAGGPASGASSSASGGRARTASAPEPETVPEVEEDEGDVI